MVDISTKLLPRDVLGTFLPDPRSIRAFEDLQQDLIDSAAVVTAFQSARALVVEANAALTGAQVFTPGAGLAVVDGGAGGAYDLSVDLTATAPIDYDDVTATISHDVSGVAAGTYGSATLSAVITVDEFGHITEVTEDAIAGGGGSPFDAPLTPPFAANFTAVNGATFSDTSTGMFVSGAAAVPAIRFAAQTAAPPVGDFVVTLRGYGVTNLFGGSNQNVGIYLRNTGTGRITLFASQIDNTLLIQNWTGFTTFSATLSTQATGGAFIPWRRVRKTGVNLFFDASPDGVNWSQILTVTVASFLVTIDQVGVGNTFNSAALASPNFGGIIHSWTVV